MHLNFDSTPAKLADNTVQDQSGNKNDADLTNGAEISNRTMGRGAIKKSFLYASLTKLVRS